MKIYLLFLFIGIVCAYQHGTTIGRLHEIADEVNALETTWKAHKINEANTSHPVNYFMGAFDSEPAVGMEEDEEYAENNCENNGLPKHFDSREHWPQCRSVINHIVDQSNCGSCWAASVSSIFSDRVCIKSKGKIQSYFSFQQLVSCCTRCHGRWDACKGGWPRTAFSYIKRNGLVTGGDYGSQEGCQPYLLPNCEHRIEGSFQSCKSLPEYNAPKCQFTCYNKLYAKSYKQDRIKLKRHYSVPACAAQNEIHKNGPILAIFPVYEDFYTYKTGVYKYTTGKLVGYHAVRIIGWGEENGVPYWLVANSWNTHWGDNGFFKFLRGSNELWFEDRMSTGEPLIHG